MTSLRTDNKASRYCWPVYVGFGTFEQCLFTQKSVDKKQQLKHMIRNQHDVTTYTQHQNTAIFCEKNDCFMRKAIDLNQ